jgi:transcriptional regulator with XRE-family HTH domain
VIVMGRFSHANATVVDSEEAEAREEALHRFVRERRLRLAPESHFLGESPRFPTRIGKRVTQEELADHLGISRQWYARFESGASAGFSTQLLSRLCDLLRLSAAERAEFVWLAMPELVDLVRKDIERAQHQRPLQAAAPASGRGRDAGGFRNQEAVGVA